MTSRPGAAEPTGAAGPADVQVRLVESTPRIPALFARAVATGRGRPGASGTLPEHRFVQTGVQQDLEKLRDYCDLTGSTLTGTVPATWLHVLTFPLQVSVMADKAFPFPMLGMVHVANSMTQHRPVGVDETLTLASWSENLAPHRKGHTVDLVGEVRSGDEVVWTGRSTYLVRGKSEPAQAQGPSGSTAEDRPAVSTEQADGSVETAESMLPAAPVAGAELGVWRLPADLGRRYAGVSGDANPIHLTGVSAKAFGFPRAIAHGMWTHARALSVLQGRLPAAFTVDVEFSKPILLPSTVVLRGSLPRLTGPASLEVRSRDGSRSHMTMEVTPA